MSMDNNQRLLRTLKALDIEIDVSTFNERLILQKKIYFIQELGIDLNYLFKWYLRGPYSQQITTDAYKLNGMLKKDIDLENNLTQQNIREILGDDKKRDRILSLISEINKLNGLDKKENAYWYELISSLHFLMRNLPKDYTHLNQAVDVLKKDKPQVFGETPIKHVKLIWKILNKLYK